MRSESARGLESLPHLEGGGADMGDEEQHRHLAWNSPADLSMFPSRSDMMDNLVCNTVQWAHHSLINTLSTLVLYIYHIYKLCIYNYGIIIYYRLFIVPISTSGVMGVLKGFQYKKNKTQVISHSPRSPCNTVPFIFNQERTSNIRKTNKV